MNATEPADPSANLYSRELELAVLAPLLDGRHPTLWATFVDACKDPLVFFVRDHRVLALAMSRLADQGAKIDAQSVIQQLGLMPWEATWAMLKGLEVGYIYKPDADAIDMSDSALAAVGGPNFVFEVMAAFGPAAGFVENCKILMRYRVQRLMAESLLDALDRSRAADGSTKLAQIADEVINRVAGLVMAQEGTALLSEAMRRAMTRHATGKLMGGQRVALWGVNALDRAVPLAPGRSIVLAAKPGRGKSSLAMQAADATAAALGDGSVAFKSLEMSAEQVGAIMLGRGLKTGAAAVTSGLLSPAQIARAEEEIAARQRTDIYFDAPTEDCPIDHVCAWIRQRHTRSGGRLALVVIDYLQLIDGTRGQSEYERVSEASRRIKKTALALNICALVLSQMSREGTKNDRDTSGRIKSDPEPRMSDLRGSGSIEQDADAVLFIWPPHEVQGGDLPVILKVAKNRHGPEDRIDAVFERANGQVFREMNSSRAHHAHPPTPAEDKYAAMGADDEQSDPQQQEPSP